MSYSSIAKLPPGSSSGKNQSKTPSPNPKKKVSELGNMLPVMRGAGAKGDVRSVKFERVTQTILLSEALPFSPLHIIQLGHLIKVRMSDNRQAFELALMDIKNDMIQVRPGEGKGGIDIVIYKDKSFNLQYFTLTAYFDMHIGFMPEVVSDVGDSSFMSRARIVAKAKEDKDLISGLLLSGLNTHEHFDDDALPNITGSPKEYAKSID